MRNQHKNPRNKHHKKSQGLRSPLKRLLHLPEGIWSWEFKKITVSEGVRELRIMIRSPEGRTTVVPEDARIGSYLYECYENCGCGEYRLGPADVISYIRKNLLPDAR